MLENIKKRIINSNIAQEKDIVGCTASEIDSLEKTYGRLNADYKEILSLLGHKAGRLINDQEFSFYLDQLQKSNQEIRKSFSKLQADGIFIDYMPSDYFVIFARYGQDIPHFIHTNSTDSKVYLLTDDEEVQVVANSVWEWLIKLIENAEYEIKEGWPDENSRYAIN
jgi:hypothetical protein